MGADPDTGLDMVVKDGRFGPYVTDGTTNASLRRGDEVESLTIERAAELLAERRAAGPAKKKATKKKAPPKKKAVRKKATAKKAAGTKKTAGTKKVTAKKAAGTKKATGPVVPLPSADDDG
jgi:DNA topoisomerase-1